MIDTRKKDVEAQPCISTGLLTRWPPWHFIVQHFIMQCWLIYAMKATYSGSSSAALLQAQTAGVGLAVTLFACLTHRLQDVLPRFRRDVERRRDGPLRPSRRRPAFFRHARAGCAGSRAIHWPPRAWLPSCCVLWDFPLPYHIEMADSTLHACQRHQCLCTRFVHFSAGRQFFLSWCEYNPISNVFFQNQESFKFKAASPRPMGGREEGPWESPKKAQGRCRSPPRQK